MKEKSQEELLAEFHKQQIAAHEIWLEHPTTQLFIQCLQNRHNRFVKTIQDDILLSSNEKSENALRANINNLRAELRIIKDSETFVKETSKK